jgi:hypothetical protein
VIPFSFHPYSFVKRARDQAGRARRFDAAAPIMQGDASGVPDVRTAMNFKWVGPIGLLAALVIGDQMRRITFRS